MPIFPTSIVYQFELTTGVWTDLTNDVIGPVIIRYGIWGQRPTDRVASSGSMTFEMKNGEKNIGGVLGYYTPGHANALGNFEIGKAVRVKITYGGVDYYPFHGTIREVRPAGGKYRTRRVRVRVVDWLADAAEHKLNLLAMSTGVRSDLLVSSVIGNMTKQPISSTREEGQTTFEYAGDGLRDEKTTALAAIQRAVLSEFGYAFVRPDTTSGGRFVFEDRHSRVTNQTVEHTLTEADLIEINALRHDNQIINIVKAAAYPREISAAATEVLYNMTKAMQISAEQTKTVVGRYRDPDQKSARISGTEMVTPLVDTDYKFGSSEGAGVNDLNANLTVTATYGGNSVEYQLQNTGGVSGYVNLLQARGKAIRMFDPQISIAQDSTSKLAYGDRPLDMNLLYQDDPLEAQDFADITLGVYKDPATYVKLVEFFGNTNSTTMAAALQGKSSTRVQVSESMTATDDEYFIDGVRMDISEKDNIRMGWALRLASSDAYWLVGTAGASEIGETTILGF